MKVLVDTTVWSLALRRKPPDLSEGEKRLIEELTRLVQQGNAILLGVVRQEVLSGIRDPGVFERIRKLLRAVEDEVLAVEHFEEAARTSNTCRAAGVTGTVVDMLICAVAMRLGAPVFTTDGDFELYARHLPLRRHAPRGSTP